MLFQSLLSNFSKYTPMGIQFIFKSYYNVICNTYELEDTFFIKLQEKPIISKTLPILEL